MRWLGGVITRTPRHRVKIILSFQILAEVEVRRGEAIEKKKASCQPRIHHQGWGQMKLTTPVITNARALSGSHDQIAFSLRRQLTKMTRVIGEDPLAGSETVIKEDNRMPLANTMAPRIAGNRVGRKALVPT